MIVPQYYYTIVVMLVYKKNKYIDFHMLIYQQSTPFWMHVIGKTYVPQPVSLVEWAERWSKCVPPPPNGRFIRHHASLLLPTITEMLLSNQELVFCVLDCMTLPVPMFFNWVGPPSSSLQKLRNITTSLMDNSSTCTLNILEVKHPLLNVWGHIHICISYIACL